MLNTRQIVCLYLPHYLYEPGAVRPSNTGWKKRKIALEKSMVVLDEISLPLSKLRINPGGNDGGHNMDCEAFRNCCKQQIIRD